MSKSNSYDHRTLYDSRHWYITWMPSMPSWRLKIVKGWCVMLYLGALGIAYYV